MDIQSVMCHVSRLKCHNRTMSLSIKTKTHWEKTLPFEIEKHDRLWMRSNTRLCNSKQSIIVRMQRSPALQQVGLSRARSHWMANHERSACVKIAISTAHVIIMPTVQYRIGRWPSRSLSRDRRAIASTRALQRVSINIWIFQRDPNLRVNKLPIWRDSFDLFESFASGWAGIRIIYPPNIRDPAE